MKSSDFFYLSLVLLMITWGYVGLPGEIGTSNLHIVSYMHNQDLNTYLSEQYYSAAENALYEFNRNVSTEALLKAIALDPYPYSKRYQDFLHKRKAFLSLPGNKEQFFIDAAL